MDSYINKVEWVKGLSVFLRGSIEEKTKCKCSKRIFNPQIHNVSILVAFLVYDLNSDGIISRDEMFQFLKSTLIKVH